MKEAELLNPSLNSLVDRALTAQDSQTLKALAAQRNPLIFLALSKNPYLPDDLVPLLLQQGNWEIVENLAKNDRLTVEQLREYALDSKYGGNRQILLEKLFAKGEWDVISQLNPEDCVLFLEENGFSTPAVISRLDWKKKNVALTVCQIPTLPASTLSEIAQYYKEDKDVAMQVIQHPKASVEVLMRFVDLHPDLIPKILPHPNVTEGEIKRILKNLKTRNGEIYSGIFLNPNVSGGFIRWLYRQISQYDLYLSEWGIPLICNPNTPEDVIEKMYQQCGRKHQDILPFFLVRLDLPEEYVLEIIKLVPLNVTQKKLILRNYIGYPRVVEFFLDDPLEEIQQEARQKYQSSFN